MENKKVNKVAKLWENLIYFFKYDVPVLTFFHNLKWYFRNVKSFRKELWDFRPWDHAYCVEIYTQSLNLLRDAIVRGNEERTSANKKIEKITELIELLKQYDTYTDSADDEIHYFNDIDLKFEIDDNDGNYFLPDKSKDADTQRKHALYCKRYKQLSLEYKKKVYKLIFGQSERELRKLRKELKQKLKEENRKLTGPSNDESYNIETAIFDGSGCRTWWD